MVHKIHADTYFVTKCSDKLKNLLTCRIHMPLYCTRGFTLVELLMVVALVGILATMAIPSFNEYIRVTRNKRCTSDIRTIDKAITAYIIDKNALPPTATALNDIGMANQFDPWKRPYIYKNLSDAGAVPLQDSAGIDLNLGYDLYSKGENNASSEVFGDPNNEDDIVRSMDGTYAGMRP